MSRSAASARWASGWVAGSQDQVVLHLGAELLAQRCLHVDLGEHAEALFLQRGAHPVHCGSERGGQVPGMP